MKHLSDTFSQYLLYLIQDKNMENSEVYKRAIVDKKTFSKIKNNVNYHPQKITALSLCVGAKLNYDVMSKVVSSVRACSTAEDVEAMLDDADMLAEINEDYQRRHK